MAAFEEREKAFEAKFAHDADLKFKAYARRNKMLGEWAAGLLGLGDSAVAGYVDALLKAGVATGDAGVLAKISADFAGKGIAVSDAEVQRQMGHCLSIAIAEIVGART